MIHTLNLEKQVRAKNLRKEIVRVFYGLVPANRKQYSVRSISGNENYYRKLAESIDKESSKK